MLQGRVGDFPVKDKIVLVTGGGSGINLELSDLAYNLGAKVIIGDLQLLPAAQKLVSDSKGAVIYEKTDVSDWRALKNLIDVSKKSFGDVPDVYVAGAGVFEPPWSNFWDDTEEESYAEVNINVGHVIKLTRLAMRAFVGNGKKGVVISIASQAGLEGNYCVPMYCATKHAVVGFTKSMGLADPYEGVKIVSICPGMVETPLFTSDKREQFGIDYLPHLLPKQVAQLMLEMIQEGKYKGGTVLSIFPSEKGPVIKLEFEDSQDVKQEDEVPAYLSKVKATIDKERA